MDRLVIVVPAIGGSVLTTPSGYPHWDDSEDAPARLLRHPERLILDNPAHAVGLVERRVLFPGLTKIDGYRRLLDGIDALVGGGVDRGHPRQADLDARVVAFPYDFRRGIEESADRLDHEIGRRLEHLRWRGQPGRVVIVAHSTGGLVARHWVARGNWDACAGLVTLGTPHRGSPKALEWLVNGAPWWGRSLFDLRELLRGWPSMYELLPRYRSVRVDAPSLSLEDEGGYAYPRHLPLDWLTGPAARADAVHEFIEREWRANAGRVPATAIVGRGYATLGESVWDGRALLTGKNEPGDGTVPESSAALGEHDHHVLRSSSGLPDCDEALAVVAAILRGTPAPAPVSQGGPWLDLEDAYEAGAPITVGPARGGRFELVGVVDVVGSEDGGTVTLPALALGTYDLRVRAGSLSTSDWFAVLDDRPEALARQADAGPASTSPTALLAPEELGELALSVRAKQVPVDEALVTTIEAQAAAYRAFDRYPRSMEPVAELAERLPLFGWLLYDTAYIIMDVVEANFESLPAQRRLRSEAAADLCRRLADAGRGLPWPEFAPRALGAVRSEALVESKRDTREGYALAWGLHREARMKCAIWAEAHTGHPERERYLLALREVQVQLALSETGTSCRTAEQVIGRWAEGLDRTWQVAEDPAWAQRMFRELNDGVRFGQEAISATEAIEELHGLVHAVDQHRLVQVTQYRNPGIMTARAALLMLSLCAHMEELGRRPLGEHASWADQRAALTEAFKQAYATTERPVVNPDGVAVPLSPPHARSMVQLRLHYALIAPGSTLDSSLDFADCVRRTVLDDDAVEALSAWLAGEENGKQRGDANVIGSATMPSFIRSVEALRAAHGRPNGYREWRRRWFVLDRYAAAEGRRELVERVLESLPAVTPSVAPPVASPSMPVPPPPVRARGWWAWWRRLFGSRG